MCHTDINLNIAPPRPKGRGFRYGKYLMKIDLIKYF
jgi:hypothetical protein